MTYLNDEEIRSILVGRRIVAADIFENQTDDAKGYLTLDNGTVLEVVGNEGCGGCSNGWYYVSGVATCDNIITNVLFDSKLVGEESYYSEAYTYKIFVIADNERINVVTVDGDDGNGYYGSGYTVQVKLPD